ncbi:hypothetical protein EB796_017848 [Bugula neritina]|uniref:Uncharacterized protein n=1 Tax=Bugula neritina TaxID=10212 RepID=A0A7J7JD45_BUGNE|nr:hypothetical protein EB796_017848 [Bugula neritina]
MAKLRFLLFFTSFFVSLVSISAIRCFECEDCGKIPDEGTIVECHQTAFNCYNYTMTDGNNKTYSRACGMSFGSDGCFTYTTATQVVHLHCNCEGDLCNG